MHGFVYAKQTLLVHYVLGFNTQTFLKMVVLFFFCKIADKKLESEGISGDIVRQQSIMIWKPQRQEAKTARP